MLPKGLTLSSFSGAYRLVRYNLMKYSIFRRT